MQKISYRAGETIFSEGDPSEKCYKIVSGKVEIRLQMPGVVRRGRSETVATCGPGEIIGEMSVIDQAPRSASAVAVEATRCEAYTADEFMAALERDPEEALRYVRTLIQRIRSSNKKISWSGGPRV